MTLDKLHKNHIAGTGEVIWPWYRIFKDRLELVKFDDVKIIHGVHNDFKQTIKKDIEKNGLLCPLVVDKDLQLHSGNHRFKILKKLGDASFFYKAQSDAEINFFSRLNVKLWEMHPNVGNIMEELWKGKMLKYTEKVPHLFSTNVRNVKKLQS
jgi:hypothetical protein